MLTLSYLSPFLSLFFSPLLFSSFSITITGLYYIYTLSLHTLAVSFSFCCAVRFLQSPNLFLRARVSAGASRTGRRFRCQWLRARRRRAPRLPRRHMQGRCHRSGFCPQGSAAASAAAGRSSSQRRRARWVRLHEGQAHRAAAQGRRRHDRRRGVRSPLWVWRRCGEPSVQFFD